MEEKTYLAMNLLYGEADGVNFIFVEY